MKRWEAWKMRKEPQTSTPMKNPGGQEFSETSSIDDLPEVLIQEENKSKNDSPDCSSQEDHSPAKQSTEVIPEGHQASLGASPTLVSQNRFESMENKCDSFVHFTQERTSDTSPMVTQEKHQISGITIAENKFFPISPHAQTDRFEAYKRESNMTDNDIPKLTQRKQKFPVTTIDTGTYCTAYDNEFQDDSEEHEKDVQIKTRFNTKRNLDELTESIEPILINLGATYPKKFLEVKSESQNYQTLTDLEIDPVTWSEDNCEHYMEPLSEGEERKIFLYKINFKIYAQFKDKQKAMDLMEPIICEYWDSFFYQGPFLRGPFERNRHE